ncbi:T9SS type A sorting domain-containing protein, partial [Aquimarina macrocephali]|uniref:T9SS type A sorting domain-containing protein n=1 Tax=Aquimarina macrocephali TaxID=666563 RepID=UPI000552375F
FKDILGKGVETVWNEYKNYINGGNTLDYDGNYPWNLDCSRSNRNNTATTENKKPEEAFNLKSYPNPIQDKLFFAKPKNLKGTSLLYEIYDTQGSLIFTEKTSRSELSLDHLESKMYFIIVKQDGKTIYRNRFIKR